MKHQHSNMKREYRESHWQGSEHTAALIAAQIAERYGEEEAANYDPEKNCFTYETWQAKGFQVRKGEKGLLSSTIKHKYDEEGNEIASWPSKCYLFYYLQVDPKEAKEEQAS